VAHWMRALIHPRPQYPERGKRRGPGLSNRFTRFMVQRFSSSAHCKLPGEPCLENRQTVLPRNLRRNGRVFLSIVYYFRLLLKQPPVVFVPPAFELGQQGQQQKLGLKIPTSLRTTRLAKPSAFNANKDARTSLKSSLRRVPRGDKPFATSRFFPGSEKPQMQERQPKGSP
jgi:hypothetical protein